MPGAEIAGLALGAVALAALFNTCIELFDYFELGRNYVCNYELACSKFELLRERLRTWGDSLHVMEPGAEDPMLRALWPTACNPVGRSLLAIRTILRSSDVLMQKYELRRDRPSRLSLHFRKRSTWAIHDKAKFDMLIQDLSFFIENLEKVAERVDGERRTQENLAGYAASEDRTFPEDDSTCSEPPGSPPSDRNRNFPSYDYTQGDYRSRSQQSPQFGRMHVVCGTQHNGNSGIGVQGVVGKTRDTYWISGVQINSERGLGIQGCVSPEALAYLAQCAFARDRFPGTM